MASELTVYRRKAKAAGWQIKGGGNHHEKWFSTDGRTIVTVPCTGRANGHSGKNLRANLRRGGLAV